MKHLKITIYIGLAFFMFFSGPVFAKKDPPPQVTVDGLVLVPDSKLALVYAEPEADLEPYTKVKLLDAYVAFKKNWARNQRSGSAIRITSNDMDRMKATMSKEFTEVFTQVLEDGGYPVVEESGEDVLLVRPAIINLNPNAPDTRQAGMSQTYVASAGDMSLYIELYDSQTGDIMAKALDRRGDSRNHGFYTWANSATNKAAAKRILKGWAMILLDALNEAKQREAADR